MFDYKLPCRKAHECDNMCAMKPITVVTPHGPGTFLEQTLRPLAASPLVETVLVVSPEIVHSEGTEYEVLVGGPFFSQRTLGKILDGTRTEYLLLLLSAGVISFEPQALERMLRAAKSMQTGLVYSDFCEVSGGQDKVAYPLNDYQLGSVRDEFDFGAALLFSVPALRRAVDKYGLIPGVIASGLYDLRLKVSIDHSVHHLKNPLYLVTGRDKATPSCPTLFAYVDPGNAAVQKEMENVFTDYLKKIGAYLPPGQFVDVEQTGASFPVEASVIIPVLNRKQTIAEAVRSALSQVTDFSFNVIVVDNHSTDGTTRLLSDLARQNGAIIHVVPARTDLGIGGCWNAALQSTSCGRYAVQLDSDDLYSSPRTLKLMVDLLHEGNYAMVTGSYTIVDSGLKAIPPGLIDHREWTDENGRNNALRVNGMGAPRAFNTALMRVIGFPNVSYGEDYAAALRISREYRVGRIYESVYLCRRWPGNTDAALTQEQINRNNAFKDTVRTEEILARQKMNRNNVHSRGRL